METDPTEAANFRMHLALRDRGLLQAAFRMPMVEILAWDAHSNLIVAANDAAQAALNTTVRQLTKRKITDVIGGVSAARIGRILANVIRRPAQDVMLRIGYLGPDGVWRLSRIYLCYLDAPQPTYVAYIQNITRYIEARTAATKAQDMLRTAIESLPDGFVLYDADDRLVICNEKYRQIYAASADAMRQGATFRQILQCGLDHGQYADGIGREADWLEERMAAHYSNTATVEQKLSSGQWLRIVERPTASGGRVGLRMDITELKTQQAQLEKIVRTDHLTGLMNRRGLTERLSQMGAALEPDERIAVLHVDLDKFKSINDAQGHDAGDFVLRHCAKILCDSMIEPETVARVGGDEFIALIKTCDDDHAILTLARSLVLQLGKPVSFRDRMCNFGASIGIAFYAPNGPDDLNATLTGADIALNEAKQAGRGVCRVFQNAMRQDAVRLIHIGQQIRHGLQDNQFTPFFQPQVNAQTGKIIGFEALIRWRHPENGLVPAFEFLLAAERADLMEGIDHVVMDRSCYAAAQLTRWGMAVPCISINLSMSQLRDPDLGARLMRYVEAYGIAPENLRLELLESTLLDERSDVIIDNVHRLIGLGFAVELDDFGTGHAAIATLRKFAVSRIKIDRSLVQNIDNDPELQVITGAIINLADRLGIKVLAEGVETSEEQDALVTLGCPCAQGYLHARPMPLDQLRSWVEAYTTA